jgi:hypothetical protein
VKLFGIISDFSQSVISIFFQAYYNNLFRYFSVFFTVNFLDVLSDSKRAVCQFHIA